MQRKYFLLREAILVYRRSWKSGVEPLLRNNVGDSMGGDEFCFSIILLGLEACSIQGPPDWRVYLHAFLRGLRDQRFLERARDADLFVDSDSFNSFDFFNIETDA